MRIKEKANSDGILPPEPDLSPGRVGPEGSHEKGNAIRQEEGPDDEINDAVWKSEEKEESFPVIDTNG
ncbi:hypothetical protein RUM43_007024 [Polyplax serrata]|uniref:Uncharacterized protein n=1 Tax=Polyplax serrata TaxID=468196 RepID=A0AAN8PC05_POLSC